MNLILPFTLQGFTYPVRSHFLEDVLEKTGYKLSQFNQIDDYGQDKLWKTQKQLAPRKRKNKITALVEVEYCFPSLLYIVALLIHIFKVTFL